MFRLGYRLGLEYGNKLVEQFARGTWGLLWTLVGPAPVLIHVAPGQFQRPVQVGLIGC